MIAEKDLMVSLVQRDLADIAALAGNRS